MRQYDNIIKEQEKHGIIERADESKPQTETHYLPHHQVVREDKSTTKVRIVFDASSKENGPSLNDCLYKGLQLNPLIFDILLRFRIYPIVLTSDIEKAFLQISVAPEHRDFLRFMWFDDVFSDQPTIIRNRFARLVFGVNSSPVWWPRSATRKISFENINLFSSINSKSKFNSKLKYFSNSFSNQWHSSANHVAEGCHYNIELREVKIEGTRRPSRG